MSVAVFQPLGFGRTRPLDRQVAGRGTPRQDHDDFCPMAAAETSVHCKTSQPAGTAGRMGAQQAGLGRPAGGPTWPMPLPRVESPRDLWDTGTLWWSRSGAMLILASEATPGKWVFRTLEGGPGRVFQG